MWCGFSGCFYYNLRVMGAIASGWGVPKFQLRSHGRRAASFCVMEEVEV